MHECKGHECPKHKLHDLFVFAISDRHSYSNERSRNTYLLLYPYSISLNRFIGNSRGI